MLRNDDTIAAISTPEGTGGIGVIRVSGPESFAVGARLFRGKKAFGEIKPGTISVGSIVNPATGEEVDEAVLLKFGAGSSYTRQDTIELQCHGGVVVLREVLDLVFAHGARPAGPGEFTLRAFLSGRMDLAQAESVMDLVGAKSSGAARAAVGQLRGAVSARLAACERQLLEAAAAIEASIDYPEYDETALPDEAAARLTEAARDELRGLAASFDRGRLLRDGISAVIAGRPNSGKSSLMNSISGHERSIVTPVPGTTRDVVDHFVSMGGVPVRLADTAGIHTSDDPVEMIGISRARSEIEKADVVVYIIDAQEGPDAGDRGMLAELHDAGVNVVLVFNKCDLIGEARRKELAAAAGELPVGAGPLFISAKNDEGVDGVEAAITGLMHAGKVERDEAILTGARHFALVNEAIACMDRALEAFASGLTADAAATDIKAALDAIGGITGKTLREDILGEIFGRFCLGK